MKLTIARKGVLLVLLPFVFELLLVGLLFWQLKSTEQQVAEETHATAVVSCADSIREMIEDAVTALMYYRRNQDPRQLKRYEELVAAAPKKMEDLKQLTANDPADFREAERIEKESQKALRILDECRIHFISSSKLDSISAFPKLVSAARSCKASLDKLSHNYRKMEEAIPEAEAQRRHSLEILLGAGLAMNLGVTGALAYFFTQSITRRVSLVRDNTKRLAQGKPLYGQLAAEDEISDLDYEFRAAAEKLTRAQEELQATTARALANEANVRSILENMPVGIVIVDDRDVIRLVNPRVEQMFGYHRDEILDRTLSALVNPDPGKFKDKRTGEVAKAGMARTDDTEARRRSGEVFFCELTVSKFIMGEGKHFLVTIEDVSERREMERMKREFVSMVSHDLRAPLTAVQGTMELLLEGTYGELTETGTRRVRVAIDSIDRLICLINDLLDIDKLEAGQMRLETASVAVDEIVQRSLESVQVLAQQSGISLDYQACALKVRGDRDRLIQVFVNLLSNSIKFSPPGSRGEVRVRAQDGTIRISVADRGRGIPADQLPLVFERFKQVKASDGARKKGTGLGLAICKAIVQAHDGEISVESTEGKGSTFTVKLPPG